MTMPTRAGVHLVVLAAALIVAGLHGAINGSSAHRSAFVASYHPPAFVAASPAPAQVHTLAGNAVASRATVPMRKSSVTVTHHAAPTRTASRAAATSAFSAALAAAVSRIPTYQPGAARWVVSAAYDFWGTADWYDNVLYVNPDVPLDKLYDVAVHEWSHELSVLDYGGDVHAAMAAMNAWFGGSGLTGAERAADCMSIEQGATWTHYTTCTDPTWRTGAAMLLAGQQL